MRWVLIGLVLLLSSNSYAKKINFCIPEFYAFTNQDGTGYYWEVLRAVYATEGIEMVHSIVPFKQCFALVERKKNDAVVSAFRTPERLKKFIYPRSRLHYTSFGLTFMKGTPYDKIENIKTSIGKIRGYDFSDWLPSNLNIYLVNHTTQAIKMLRLKRLAYHADDLTDIELVIKKLGEKREDFVLKSLYTKDLYTMYTKDARGQKMANIFDRGLQKIYASGKMEKIVKKYGLKDSILKDF